MKIEKKSITITSLICPNIGNIDRIFKELKNWISEFGELENNKFLAESKK